LIALLAITTHYFFGSSSYSGNSLEVLYHSAFDAQNIFWCGFIPGFPSSVPAGMTTTLPPFERQGNEDPQFLQNAVAKYLVSFGEYVPTIDSPLTHLN
jgi:hypothetical protein